MKIEGHALASSMIQILNSVPATDINVKAQMLKTRSLAPMGKV